MTNGSTLFPARRNETLTVAIGWLPSTARITVDVGL